MSDIIFEWDERKAHQNEQKHRISLEEAQTAFDDENARLSHDPDHSQDEDRYILLGMSAVLRILVVCHVYRQNDEVMRIISARRATKQEQKQYHRFLR
ncbi:BrnT family toxin [Spirulina sp. CCNP1310]|uniref:BrnT family toxin n=1 Tax=Spirulina sp. CCNP1310 TaxID=3110249 RepID=UPI002B200883|nr:BrnT family toxin [Spirulina sp. CCNP1310]MEA5421163.1 BrnT family toxin [Spirulina sp. CCNP1310]